MLNLAQFNEFQKLQANLAALGEKLTTNEERVKAVMDAREKLGTLACSVMPPELHERVQMLGYKELSSLVDALCTGKDDSEKDDPEKKVVFKSQAVGP